jgi:hypothetical protein
MYDDTQGHFSRDEACEAMYDIAMMLILCYKVIPCAKHAIHSAMQGRRQGDKTDRSTLF